MKIKRGLLFCLAVIVMFSMVILYGCRNVIRMDSAEVIETNWDVEMPEGAKEIFYKSSGASFLGDGERYSVYECEDDDSIEKSFEWKDDKDKFIVEGFEDVIHKIRSYEDGDIPKEYVPNLSGEFLYYYKELEDNSKLYIIHIPKENRIYISENIF